MRKILVLLALLMSFAVPLRSQNLTTVTATVSDSAGTVYSFGNYTVNLVNTTNQQPLFGGNANFQQVYSGALDTNGLLSISLPSVTAMTPSPGLQWKFFICANPLQIAAVFPKPALPCFTYTSTGTQISGSSVDLSASMTPTIIPKAGQGGSGTFTTITAANQNGVLWVDGKTYTTIDAAIAAVPVFTISACSESGTTATCTTTAPHGFSIGQGVFLQNTSVTGYGDEQKLISPTSGTTFTFTTSAGLGASTGGTVAAITTIIIPSTYFGAEASTCANVDLYPQSLTPNNLTIIDYRGNSTCGYNVAFNSSQQGAKPSRMSVWNSVVNPVNTSSAIIATNQMTGIPPAVGTIAAITSETDITGTLGAGAFPAVISTEAALGIRSLGNTLPLVIGAQMGGGIDRSYATTNVTNFAAARCDQIANSSTSGATITNAYGCFAPAQNKGTARNYSVYAVTGSGGTNFGAILLGYGPVAGASALDAEDPGGTPHRLLTLDSSNNTNLYSTNTSTGCCINLNRFDGGLRAQVTNTGFSIPATFALTFVEGTVSLGVVGSDVCDGNSSNHWLECSYNNGAFSKVPLVGVANTWTAAQNISAAASGIVGTVGFGYDSTTATGTYNTNNGGVSSFSGAWQCTNVTPVTTSGGAVTTDQNMMACTIPAGTLNRVGRTLRVKIAGVYSTPAASVSQMTLKVKICSVSGCGSGNVLTALSIQSTALGTVQITNDNFSLRGELTTQTAAATLAEEAHGEYLIDLATLTTAADSVFGDGNIATQTGTPSAIDSTAQNFLQVTFAFSSASASNVATQRQLILETVN